MHNIGCPSVVRSDYGTENVKVAAIQIAFRYHHTDGMANQKSFLYGPSKSNIVRYIVVASRNIFINHIIMIANRSVVVPA